VHKQKGVGSGYSYVQNLSVGGFGKKRKGNTGRIGPSKGEHRKKVSNLWGRCWEQKGPTGSTEDQRLTGGSLRVEAYRNENVWTNKKKNFSGKGSLSRIEEGRNPKLEKSQGRRGSFWRREFTESLFPATS